MIKNILRSSIFVLIASLVSKMVSFIFNLICIRMLSSYDYGQLAIIRSTAAAIEGGVTGAFGILTINKVAEEREDAIISLLIATLLPTLISISIFLCFWDDLATYIKFEGNITLFIWAISLLSIVSVLYSFFINIFVGLNFYKEQVFSSLLSSSLSLPIIYVLVSKLSFRGAVFGLVIFYLLDFSFKLILLLNRKFKISIDLTLVRKVLFTSKYYFINTFCALILFWFFKVDLAAKDGGLVEVANFDVMYQFLTLIMLITGVTSNVVLAYLSKKSIAKEIKERLFYATIIINLIIVIILSIPVFFYSEMILSFINSEYVAVENGKIINILLIVAIFFTFNSLLIKYMASASAHKIVTISSVISCAITLIFKMLAFESYTGIELSLLYLVYYLSNTIILFLYKFFAFSKNCVDGVNT